MHDHNNKETGKTVAHTAHLNAETVAGVYIFIVCSTKGSQTPPRPVTHPLIGSSTAADDETEATI